MGRANGGMVVHIGVVVIAIGLAAATSFLHRGELHLAKGQTATFAGHTVTFVGTRQVTTPSHSAFEAVLRVDGGGMFYPAISQFGSGTQAVGTPAIDSSWRDDLYLTIDSIPTSGSTWTFGVVEQPLVMWLWIGAVLVGIGSVLSAIPGRRRRPTDPVSAPVVARSPGPSRTPTADDRRPEPAAAGSRPEAEADPLPVGAGDPGMTATEVRRPDQREQAPVRAGTPPAGWRSAVLVIAAGLIAVLATRPPATVDEVQNPVVGRMAPPISGETLAGTRYSLPRAPGKFVVVSFFASWCDPVPERGARTGRVPVPASPDAVTPPCSASCSATAPATPRPRRPGSGVTWPTMADNGGTIALDYGVRQLPSTFVIAPDGRVVASIVSQVTAAELDQIMAKAKAEHA